MKPQEIFGLAVRLAGLYCLVMGLQTIEGLFFPTEGLTPTDHAVSATIRVLTGLALLIGADMCVWVSYRRWPG